MADVISETALRAHAQALASVIEALAKAGEAP
jgi:hypothetical protein